MSIKRRSNQTAFSLFSFQDIITSITGIMILITLILAVELITRTLNAPPVQTAQQIETTEKSVAELKVEIANYRRKLKEQDDNFDALPSLDQSELERITKRLQESTERLQSENMTLKQQQSKRQKLLESNKQQVNQERVLTERELAELNQEIAELKQQIAKLEKSNRVFYQDGVQGKAMWLIEVTAVGFTVAEIGVKSAPATFATVSALANWLASLDSSATAIFLTIKPSGVINFESCKKEIEKRSFDLGFQVVGEQQQVIDPQIGAGVP